MPDVKLDHLEALLAKRTERHLCFDNCEICEPAAAELLDAAPELLAAARERDRYAVALSVIVNGYGLAPTGHATTAEWQRTVALEALNPEPKP